MQPKKKSDPNQGYLFESMTLMNMCNHNHPLYILSNQIDWSYFDTVCKPLYREGFGCPAKPTRLLVALHYLKYTFNLSDEATVGCWLENPYWQYFSGETVFQKESPIDPSSMTRWRKRMGEDRLRSLLSETIRIAKESKAVSNADLSRVTVDSTVQEKNITFPTDAKLSCKGIEKCVEYAKKLGIKLRQSYTRKSKCRCWEASRYAHAKQWNRHRQAVQDLKNWLGRIVREVYRKCSLEIMPEGLKCLLSNCERLLAQTRYSKDKLYSFNEPEVQCISKGKSRIAYEFGQKVSFAITNRTGWIISALVCPKNPYDGKTLSATIGSAESLTGVEVKEIYVDKGYRGNDYNGTAKVIISGCRKAGLSRAERDRRRRRSAIEPIIGHLKSDHRLGRCYLKGQSGDETNVILAAAGKNMLKLLNLIAKGSIFPSFLSCVPYVWHTVLECLIVIQDHWWKKSKYESPILI